jgi:hypothetical protein
MLEKHDDEHPNDLGVAVLTTSGRWPTSGFEKASVNEKVRHVLQQAARHLHLTGTDDWIATVGAGTLNVDESFRANGFIGGEIQIDFGPRQGGGGA